MMLKIISGGQTGADQGALDAAIKLGLPYGGWIPKGRKTEDGLLPKKYCLKEMPTSQYSQWTQQNVIDSDGTLIVSHGKLSGGSGYCRKMAIRHAKPWLHIDLMQIVPFLAAISVKKWVIKQHIQILNVAGPQASKDLKIYQAVFNLIETIYYLLQVEEDPFNRQRKTNLHGQNRTNWPVTVEKAVALLIKRISLKDRMFIANLLESELGNLDFTLGRYIRDHFGLWGDNQILLNDCLNVGDMVEEDYQTAVATIIKTLWSQLRKTHRLRVIK